MYLFLLQSKCRKKTKTVVVWITEKKKKTLHIILTPPRVEQKTPTNKNMCVQQEISEEVNGRDSGAGQRRNVVKCAELVFNPNKLFFWGYYCCVHSNNLGYEETPMTSSSTPEVHSSTAVCIRPSTVTVMTKSYLSVLLTVILYLRAGRRGRA